MTTTLLSAPSATKLALRFGRSKSVIAVDSILEASEAWCKLRDEQGLGASDSPKVTVIDTATGKTVATISYNGRAWEGTKEGGKEISLDGYKIASEHNADGWKDCIA